MWWKFEGTICQKSLKPIQVYGQRKGEDFQLKGFLKGQDAEYFEESKGYQPVSHFSVTLKSQKECRLNLRGQIVIPDLKYCRSTF